MSFDVSELSGFREWADAHYPIGPGWNTATNILLRQAWMNGVRQERERCAKIAEWMPDGTGHFGNVAHAIRNSGEG